MPLCTRPDANAPNGYKDYRENTYLTFQLQKGFPERTLDGIQTLESLQSDIREALDKDADAVVQATQELSKKIIVQQKQNDVTAALAKLNKELDVVSSFNARGVHSAFSNFWLALSTKIKEKVICESNSNCEDENAVSEHDIITWQRQAISMIMSAADNFSYPSLHLGVEHLNSDDDLSTEKEKYRSEFIDAYISNYRVNKINYYITLIDDLEISHMIAKESAEDEDYREVGSVAVSLLLELREELQLISTYSCFSSPKEECDKLLKKDEYDEVFSMLGKVLFDITGDDLNNIVGDYDITLDEIKSYLN